MRPNRAAPMCCANSRHLCYFLSGRRVHLLHLLRNGGPTWPISPFVRYVTRSHRVCDHIPHPVCPLALLFFLIFSFLCHVWMQKRRTAQVVKVCNLSSRLQLRAVSHPVHTSWPSGGIFGHGQRPARGSRRGWCPRDSGEVFKFFWKQSMKNFNF